MKFKKLLLGLGSLAAITAPIVSVISCGEADSAQYSEDDLLRMSNLKSDEAKAKLQDLWLSKVLIQEYGIDSKSVTPLELLQDISKGGTSGFEKDFTDTLTWILKEKLFESKDALSSIYQSLKSSAPESIIGNDSGVGELSVIKELEPKIFDRSKIEAAVTAVMSDATWKDIFYNQKIEKVDGTDTLTFNPSILGIKDLVLKMMVTKKFLRKTSDDYKAKLPAEYAKLASKYRDATVVMGSAANFPLVVSAMNGRFAYKNSVELETVKSKQFIVVDKDNEFKDEAEAFDSFDDTKSIFEPAFTFSFRKETAVDSLLAREIKPELKLGFKGIAALPSGKDSLNTLTASALKLVGSRQKEDGSWLDGSVQRDGFIATKDGQAQIFKTEIPYTDEEDTKVVLDYYTSLMPYMYAPKATNSSQKTLGYDPASYDDEHLDKLMNIAYTKDSALYSTAISYFTAEDATVNKVDEKQVLIDVTNEWARNYYIDEGIKYINPDEDDK